MLASMRGTSAIVLATAVLGASALVHLPGLFVGPSLDAAVFDVVGWQVTHGVPLYAGIWDHKPPGIHLIYAGLEAIRGGLDPWLLPWLLSVLACAGTALLIARVLARMGLAAIAPAVAVLAALLGGQYLLSLGGGLSEEPATFLALSSIVIATGGSRTLRWVVAGACLAAAVLVAVQVAPAAVALLVLAWRQDRDRLRAVFATLSGGLLVLSVTIGALAAVGLLPAAVDAVITYNAAYRAAGESAGLALRALPWTVLALLAVGAPAAAGILAMRRLPPTVGMGLAALAWIAGGVLLLVLQARFYAHYAMPLIVPLAVLAGIGLTDLLRILRRSRVSAIAGALAVMALVAASTVAGAAGGVQELSLWRDANAQSRSVAEALGEPAPGETMLVWGNQPYLYRLADRAPAMRYPFLLPLMTPGYATPDLIASVRAELEADPPVFVVDAGSPGVGLPGLPPLLLDRPVGLEGRDVDLLDPLRDFVRENYEQTQVVDGWPVYRLR
jgi:hypothetical protein